MKARFAMGLLVLGLLVGCNGGGPTAPKNSLQAPPTPVVSQPPLPEATPTPEPCRPMKDCGE